MGVIGIILLVLALKLPIVGLLTFVYWLTREPAEGADAERVRAKLPPRLPEPGGTLRPRRRGPHGGAALPLPSPRRDPHPAATPRETAPAPSSRSIREAGRTDAAGAPAE